VWPPAIVADTEEERQEIVASIDHIDAKCVARLAVPPDRMIEFLDAIKQNVENYRMVTGTPLDTEEEGD